MLDRDTADKHQSDTRNDHPVHDPMGALRDGRQIQSIELTWLGKKEPTSPRASAS